MANSYRGEITAKLDGRDWQLCLTLGALAELETKLGEDDVGALAGRFSSGRLSAKDMQVIIAAGLRGGGHDISDQEVGEMRTENGVTGYAEIVAQLLSATFYDPAQEAQKSSSPNPSLPQKTSPSLGI